MNVVNLDNVEDVVMADYERITVYYDGAKTEYAVADLDIAMTDDNRCDPTDAQVKEALLVKLEAENLDGFTVDRYEKVINVRPDATLG